MKALIATEKPFAEDAVRAMCTVLEEEKIECVLLEKYKSKAELCAAIADVDAVIVRSDVIDQEVLDAAKNLRLIVRAGAGYDTIDIQAAKAKDVVVMNTPGQNANAVAELVFGMLLQQIRNQFDGTTGRELRGLTIGLHAFGHVGNAVAQIAKGFGMRVCAYDPFLSDESMQSLGVESVNPVETLYRTCDIVSVHAPANEQTKQSINYDLVSLMPKKGILVNTARKELIDEEGLLRLLEERTDLSYVADVKPDIVSRFEKSCGSRVWFTPKKMGAQTLQANANAGLAAARQVAGYLLEGIDRYRLN